MKNKTLVIMAHSNPKDSKFNKVIQEALQEEETIIYKDIKSLYDNFNFDVKKEQQDIIDAQKIVFQFPLYWYTAPSILKQWVDDIFAYDFAFKYNEAKEWEALALVGKKFQMVVTLGGSKEEYEEIGININNCLSSYSSTALVLGMEEQKPYLLYGVDSNKYSNEELDNIVLDIKESVLN